MILLHEILRIASDNEQEDSYQLGTRAIQKLK